MQNNAHTANLLRVILNSLSNLWQNGKNCNLLCKQMLNYEGLFTFKPELLNSF